MNDRVQSYSLPEGASTLDRTTLSAWRWWDSWLKPIILAGLLMTAGHLAVSLVSGRGDNGGLIDFHQWRLLVKWGADQVKLSIDWRPGSVMRVWAIALQLLASGVGALAGWIVLRRARRPAVVGGFAGALAAAVHVWLAGLMTLRPFEPRQYATFIDSHNRAIPPGPHPVTLGSIAWNIAGVVALWSPILFGTAVGYWVQWRRNGKGNLGLAGAHADQVAQSRGE